MTVARQFISVPFVKCGLVPFNAHRHFLTGKGCSDSGSRQTWASCHSRWSIARSQRVQSDVTLVRILCCRGDSLRTSVSARIVGTGMSAEGVKSAICEITYSYIALLANLFIAMRKSTGIDRTFARNHINHSWGNIFGTWSGAGFGSGGKPASRRHFHRWAGVGPQNSGRL